MSSCSRCTCLINEGPVRYLWRAAFIASSVIWICQGGVVIRSPATATGCQRGTVSYLWWQWQRTQPDTEFFLCFFYVRNVINSAENKVVYSSCTYYTMKFSFHRGNIVPNAQKSHNFESIDRSWYWSFTQMRCCAGKSCALAFVWTLFWHIPPTLTLLENNTANQTHPNGSGLSPSLCAALHGLLSVFSVNDISEHKV